MATSVLHDGREFHLTKDQAEERAASIRGMTKVIVKAYRPALDRLKDA